MKGKVLFMTGVLAVVMLQQANGQCGGRDRVAVLQQRVDSIVQAAVGADLIPGAVVRIERDGKTVYFKAYRWSQKYDYDRRAVRPAAEMEKVSGMRLDRFEEENVFKYLGMIHTTYNPLQHGRTSDIAATALGNPYEYRMVHDSTLGFAIPGLDPQSWNGWRHYDWCRHPG